MNKPEYRYYPAAVAIRRASAEALLEAVFADDHVRALEAESLLGACGHVVIGQKDGCFVSLLQSEAGDWVAAAWMDLFPSGSGAAALALAVEIMPPGCDVVVVRIDRLHWHPVSAPGGLQ
ncbi:hypothetical protein OPU71_07000 [Niveibacterium sp. 24ML]|uniref:hypothetical protein n=1 Tax=Niveibacterium sp. 24ML TaxID=2985512 RepID=UPI00226ED5CF|nr:hypothetical protein [Niveibacterium sp. 24ML]MCX9155875.1 hypothetical protein [Niveibacterium sp. 24ML]